MFVNILAVVIAVSLTIASIKLALTMNDHWKIRADGILYRFITLICSSICAITIVLIWGAVHYLCH